jgi:simple sugar transport system permease protein/ribose transport system permease protein
MTTSERQPRPALQPSPPGEIGARHKAADWLQEHFIWVLVVLMAIAGTAENRSFATASNVTNIFIAAAPLGFLVLGQSLVLITGHMDLSTEANMIFCAVAAGIAISPHNGVALGSGWGWPWPAVILLMLFLGSLIGAVNGGLVAYLGMNPFMATLAMMVGLTGLSLQFGGGRLVDNLPGPFIYVGNASWGRFPVAVLVMLFAFALTWVLLSKLVLGRRMYAVGSARKAARATGVKDRRVIFCAYSISGLLSGLAGFLLVGQLDTAGPSISSGALFISIAAAVMGGVSLFGGRGKVTGMLGGLVLMASITNALNLANFPSTAVDIVTGGVILIAVLFDAVRTRAWRI